MDSSDDTPADVEAHWDHEGLTAVLPGGLFARSEMWTGVLVLGVTSGLLAVLGTGLWAMNGAEVSGAALVSALACALSIPLGLLPVTALGQTRMASAPLTVTIAPRGSVSARWSEEVAPLVVATRDIRSVRVSAGPTPRLVLDVVHGDGGLKTHTLRVRTEAHGRWLARQIEAARTHDAERDGAPEDVPGELAALQRRRRTPEM